jgi:hypothetical protein
MVNDADAGVDFFGFLTINPVEFGGFSNPARFWKELLKR